MSNLADRAAARRRIAVGLVITTIGRPTLRALLDSVAWSTELPAAVAIANQSGAPLDIDLDAYPYPITVVQSTGGSSKGRNDGFRALPADIEIVGFPNDDSVFDADTLAGVAARFASHSVGAVACTPVTSGKSLRALPPAGVALDRKTVWRAIEWTTFVDCKDFAALGGFDPAVGTGSPSPWQSGEGTDLLLRLMEIGKTVISAADVAISGPGERRSLSDDDFVAKHRRYGRGTGYVYRAHNYPYLARARIVIAPLLRLSTFEEPLPLALRIAWARTIGRLEGLFLRPVGTMANSARHGPP